MNLIRKEDILDQDIVDAYELSSDGYYAYLTTSIVSTVSGSNTININLPSDNEGIIYTKDHPAKVGDRVRLIGTSGASADGYYLIASILTDTSFTVSTPINSSTGGTIYFMYMPGSKYVGFDPTGLTSTSSTNIQDALRDIAVNSSGITQTQHENLDTLVHDLTEDGYTLITYTGNNITNYTMYTSPAMTTKIREYQISYTITPCNQKINQVITIQYNNLGVPINTLTETATYINNRIISFTSVKT